jgi:hypothetical protein
MPICIFKLSVKNIATGAIWGDDEKVIGIGKVF